MSDARSLYKEGFEHYVAERFAEAIQAYRRALELDPALAIAWNGLGMALARHGDLDGAIEAGRRLVELEPDDPLSHTSLSRLYQQRGLIEDAEREKAISMQLQMKQRGGSH